MNELISIVIPVYNVEQYLAACVDCVKKQSYRNIEIILVDDGSTDSSGEMCDEIKLTDSRIQVIHKKNGGLSDARNKGLEYAKGKYVIFVDSDDVIDIHMVQYLYELVKEDGADIGICDPVHCYPNQKAKYMAETKKQVFLPEQAICEMLYQKSFLVSAWGKIYKKEFFDDIKFPFGMLFEDSAVMYRIFEKADKIVYGNAKLYGYMHREGSITTKNFSRRDCDILIICDQITEYMTGKSVELQKAASSYQVAGALRIYMNAPAGNEFQVEIENSKQIIKKKGMGVLRDTNARKKTRIAIFMFFAARPLMPMVYKRINRWK